MPHRPLLPFYSSHILHNNKALKFSKKTNLPDAWTLSLCQFGEHLLPLCPKLPLCSGESRTDRGHLLLSLSGIPLARHSGLGGGEEDGRRGISNAEKVLDAVKSYVEMVEVWA